MADGFVKVGVAGLPVKITVEDATVVDGVTTWAPMDLTGQTIEVRLKSPRGTVKSFTGVTVLQNADEIPCIVSFTTGTNDFPRLGTYKFEVFLSAGPHTFPSAIAHIDATESIPEATP